MMKSKTFHLWILLTAVIGLAGCERTAETTRDANETDVLMKRANEYWEAARLFDLRTMYDMELAVKEGRYIPADAAAVLAAPTRIAKYELKNPAVTGDSGTVELAMSVVMAKYGGRGWDLAPRQDQWTKVDGVWYHGAPYQEADASAGTQDAGSESGETAGQGPIGGSLPPAAPAQPREAPPPAN